MPTADAGSERPDMEHFALVIETINGTAWGPIARYMLKTKAQVLLCQEHHLGPGEVAAASAFALRLGWKPKIVPATKGDGGGWRGGVAIFARGGVVLAPPRVGPQEIIRARALAMLVEAPGYRPFTAVSVYLEHGKGMGPDNAAHMQELGLFLEAQGSHVPYVMGGDFQCDPAVMANFGFARRTTASLVASRDPRGTCRSTTATSEIDYFFCIIR